jgi:hypothetical protein
LVFEVQYLPSLIEGGKFDMIYHEHHDYHQVGPLFQFLRKFRLYMADYEFIPTHGGSIRVTAKWEVPCERTLKEFGIEAYWEPPETPKYPPEERINWGEFAVRVSEARKHVQKQLSQCSRIVAFGATAKACTLIHHFGIAPWIEYCVDSTPGKQGRYIPGTNIPIMSPQKLYDQQYTPDAVLLTAWNYEQEIRAKNPGLNFVVPFANELKEAA